MGVVPTLVLKAKTRILQPGKTGIGSNSHWLAVLSIVSSDEILLLINIAQGCSMFIFQAFPESGTSAILVDGPPERGCRYWYAAALKSYF